MIALLLLASGGGIALYGHLCMEDSPASSKADGLVVAAVGYVMLLIGLIVMALA